MKTSSNIPFPSALRPPVFLGTLKSEIKEAAQTKHPVLVLIFGHGEKETSEIFPGCDEGGLYFDQSQVTTSNSTSTPIQCSDRKQEIDSRICFDSKRQKT
jgi:hypothetical protein